MFIFLLALFSCGISTAQEVHFFQGTWKEANDLNTDDREILMKAVNWMKPVIEAEPVWMYLDTYAALLYKSGDLEEALKYADQAIEAGRKANEEDISSTEELRENIMKAMNGGE